MEVLVIDDTRNIRLLLTKCLEYEGYHVTAAENGKDALGFISSRRFDLVFLDVRMPEISGTEVLRRIREMGVRVPVIMITAFGTVRNAVECTQLGAVAYLQKPFTENKIKQVLAEVLQAVPEPTSVERTVSLAGEHIKNRRFPEAEQLLKSALSNNPLEPQVYRMLEELYASQGKTEEAEKCAKIVELL